MGFFIESEVRQRAQDEVRRNVLNKADKILIEESKEFSEDNTYDIFLSHSFNDAELILGIKGVLEDLGYSIFVDWFNDPELDRSNISEKTASILKLRMNTSKSLFYVDTENSTTSKWMPWECGYFDGFKEKVAILPIRKSVDLYYSGQEYLSLYPYCTKKSDSGKEMLLIHKNVLYYVSYKHWVSTPNTKIEWE